MAKDWMPRLLLALGALGLCLVATAGTASAQDGGAASEAAGAGDAGGTVATSVFDGAEEDDESEIDAEITESVEDDADRKSWNVNANSSISVGVGSFYSTEEGGTQRVRWGFGFGASYTIPVIDVTAAVGTGFSQWLTRGGGSQVPQEFRWSDTDVSLSRAIYTIPVVDIGISGSLGYTIPTSTFSRNTDSYGTISPGLGLSWNYGGLGLSYGINYFHNFHKYTSTTFDPSDVDILSRNAGGEVITGDAIAEAGVLTEFGVSNNFGVNYRFLEQFSVGLGFGFFDSWSYDNGTITQEDEFVAENADVGRFHGQSTNGSLRFGYNPIEYLGLSLSLRTSQPWKTADNQGYRFPFFDFDSPQDSNTYLGFGISGNY